MRVAVIGLGLIGGSLLQALAGCGHQVHGYDADPATRAMARTAAARAPATGRWQVAGSVRDTVADADLVVLAVPLPAVSALLQELAGCGYPGIVTDVTSVKTEVDELAGRHLLGAGRPAGFVGGHPMAGREVSGFTAADPRLFDGCAWVLCLEPGRTDLGDWLRVAQVVIGLSARVVPTTAAEHDRAAALVSHLPHLLATALVRGAVDDPLALSLGAGSFRDGTRVAAARAELTAAMCGGNAQPLRRALATLRDLLDQADQALQAAEPVTALRPWFEPAVAVRTGWPPAITDPVELPADPDVLLRLGRAGGWVTAVTTDHRFVTAVRPR